MYRPSFLLLFLLACGSPEPREPPVAEGAHEPDSGSVLVRCGRLIDGVSNEAVDDVDVYIEEGTIVRVGVGLAYPWIHPFSIRSLADTRDWEETHFPVSTRKSFFTGS